MMTKHAVLAVLMLVLSACAKTFPENPTPAELDEMHEIMSECLSEIIPLETDYSQTCQNVEDALIAHYGSLTAFLEAHKAHE